MESVTAAEGRRGASDSDARYANRQEIELEVLLFDLGQLSYATVFLVQAPSVPSPNSLFHVYTVSNFYFIHCILYQVYTLDVQIRWCMSWYACYFPLCSPSCWF